MNNLKPTISFIGNNQYLINLVSNSFNEKNIVTETFELSKPPNYLIFLLQPNTRINIREFDPYFSKIDHQTKIAFIVQLSQLDTGPLNKQILNDLTDLASRKKLDARTIFVWDLVSNEIAIPISSLDQIIKESFEKQQINISRNGNLKLFPLAYTDFFEGLSRCMFLNNTTGQTFHLAGSLITDMDFAYNLKNTFLKKGITLEINQNLSLNPNRQDPESQVDSTSAALNWLAGKDLDSLTTEIVSNFVAKSKKNKDSFSKTPQPPNKTNLIIDQTLKAFEITSLFRIILIIFGTSVFLFTSIFVAFIFFFTTSLANTTSAYEALRRGDIEESSQLIESSSRKLKISQNLYQLTSVPINLVNQDFGDSITFTNSLVSHTHELMKGFHRLYSLGNSYYQDSLSGVDVDQVTLSTTLVNQLESFQTELNQLLLTSQQSKPDTFKLINLNLPKNLEKENINLLKSQVSQAITLVKLLPLTFPEDKMVKYLILIQDNNELRSSGGFLNTYTLLTFQKNKLIDLQIDTSLRLDAKLLGQVEPPSSLSQLTGNNYWNFSDSNFSPSFPETAKQVSWFFEKVTNQKVDGVIALNLSFFENYLRYTKPLNLTNEEINSDNLRLILANPTQNDSEDNLTKLTKLIFSDIKSQKVPFASTARAFLDAANSGDINLWFSDEKIENTISTTNLSGTIKNIPCPPQFVNTPCFPETYYFNESNFSINKSNFYSKRQIDHIVNLNNSNISHQITINYSYPNPVPKTGNLQYQALIRFYTPSTSNLTSVILDDQPLDQKSINISSKYGLNEIEFPLKFILNQNHRLVISLNSNQKFTVNGTLASYSLTHYKQPGITNTTIQTTINYDDSISPKILSQPAEQLRQKLVFDSKGIMTTTYAVAFSSLSR
jgi:hypothetical protein